MYTCTVLYVTASLSSVGIDQENYGFLIFHTLNNHLKMATGKMQIFRILHVVFVLSAVIRHGLGLGL